MQHCYIECFLIKTIQGEQESMEGHALICSCSTRYNKMHSKTTCISVLLLDSENTLKLK